VAERLAAPADGEAAGRQPDGDRRQRSFFGRLFGRA
jgi:hypothetical protein